MRLKALNWPLIMSPSDQFMAANVVLSITFQLLFYFLSQVATKNRFLTLLLFYGAQNSLVYVILGALFRGVADTFVLRCGYLLVFFSATPRNFHYLKAPAVKRSDVYKNHSPLIARPLS